MTRHVIGLYSTPEAAHDTVVGLLSEGVPDAAVSVLSWEDPTRGEEVLEYDQEERAEAINTGMWSGGALGALAGLLAGISILVAPVGAVAVIGALSTALGGATVGATMGGFAASLMNLGLTPHDADHLMERLEAGATAVAVAVPIHEAPAMAERLTASGAEDVKTA